MEMFTPTCQTGGGCFLVHTGVQMKYVSKLTDARRGDHDSAIFLTAARPLLTAGTRITAQVIAPSAKMYMPL